MKLTQYKIKQAANSYTFNVSRCHILAVVIRIRFFILKSIFTHHIVLFLMFCMNIYTFSILCQEYIEIVTYNFPASFVFRNFKNLYLGFQAFFFKFSFWLWILRIIAIFWKKKILNFSKIVDFFFFKFDKIKISISLNYKSKKN